MTTVFHIFMGVAAGAEHRSLVSVPKTSGDESIASCSEISYSEMAERVVQTQRRYQRAGFGHGHRVGVVAPSRPIFLEHFLALNGLGVSLVAINPELADRELIHILRNSEPSLLLGEPERLARLSAIVDQAGLATSVVALDSGEADLPPAPSHAPDPSSPSLESEAAVLYTSGSTGFAKGCRLSNRYMLTTGQWYVSNSGVATFRHGQERLYSAMPLFHMTGLCMISVGVILSGNCLVMPERFRPSRFWEVARAASATAMHYLGVMPAMLLAQEKHEGETSHGIRFGIGGGADPQLRRAFEARFGIPLIEGWGMTEIGRTVFNGEEPTYPDERAVGRPRGNLRIKILRADGDEAAAEEQGEIAVQHAGADPRFGFFSGYLRDEAATAQAWDGDWLRTGDIGLKKADGTLVFVDRLKNIVRRSGENIAASEVEQVILTHPRVKQAAVLAVADEIRQEEVFACVELESGEGGPELARSIFDLCARDLAYFKAPGWILFRRDLPLTSTHKVAKARIWGVNQDPRSHPGVYDFRSLKRPPGAGGGTA